MRSSVALAFVLILSSCTEGGRCIVSNTDFGVPEREEPPPSLGAGRGGSGNGRLFIKAPDAGAGTEGPRQAPMDLCEGVGEGGGNICKRVGVGFHLGVFDI